MRPHPRLGESAIGLTTLFLAGGTLVCCALPILLVTLGLGTAVAAITSTAPWLVTLSHYKAWMFTASGTALAVAGYVLFQPERECPVEPELARLCAQADRWNRRVYWAAVVLWSVGAFTAYLWLSLRHWLER